MTLPMTECSFCQNYQGRLQCKAFPLRIPNSILSAQELHHEVRDDQKGDFVFEPIKESK